MNETATLEPGLFDNETGLKPRTADLLTNETRLDPAEPLPLVDRIDVETELENKTSIAQPMLSGFKVDCLDKTCSLEYRVLPTCVMYEPNPRTNCDIPCNLANCSVEVRHFFDCPIWTCKAKGTTPAPFTPVTLKPLPSHGSSTVFAFLYTSATFNLVFFGLCLFAIFKVRQLRRNMRQGRRLSEHTVESGILRNSTNPDPSAQAPRSDLAHFSLDESNEVQPLLSRRPRTENETSNAAHRSLLQRLQNFHWSFSTRSWIETQPESNELSTRNEASNPQCEASDSEGREFEASAPTASPM